MRILVVEDEKKVAKALQEGLEGERYEVAVAHTGEEGFFLANTQAFDLVVLDLMIPRRPVIDPENQSRVFDRFYRVDKARPRDAGGAGLGLSIAKWAVVANGGRIELESEKNKGCTFRIRLPLVQVQKLSIT